MKMRVSSKFGTSSLAPANFPLNFNQSRLERVGFLDCRRDDEKKEKKTFGTLDAIAVSENSYWSKCRSQRRPFYYVGTLGLELSETRLPYSVCSSVYFTECYTQRRIAIHDLQLG